MIGTILDFLMCGAIIFIAIIFIGSMAGLFGCAGDCKQGRQKCDCKDKHE